MIIRITTLTCVSALLASCAATPHIAKVRQGNEEYLNCKQLDEQIQIAVKHKVDSRKEDRFQVKYMMPITAVLSVITINMAESAAKKRIKYLENVKMHKRCHVKPMYNVNPIGQTPAMSYYGRPSGLDQLSTASGPGLEYNGQPYINSGQPYYYDQQYATSDAYNSSLSYGSPSHQTVQPYRQEQPMPPYNVPQDGNSQFMMGY